VIDAVIISKSGNFGIFMANFFSLNELPSAAPVMTDENLKDAT